MSAALSPGVADRRHHRRDRRWPSSARCDAGPPTTSTTPLATRLSATDRGDGTAVTATETPGSVHRRPPHGDPGRRPAASSRRHGRRRVRRAGRGRHRRRVRYERVRCSSSTAPWPSSRCSGHRRDRSSGDLRAHPRPSRADRCGSRLARPRARRRWAGHATAVRSPSPRPIATSTGCRSTRSLAPTPTSSSRPGSRPSTGSSRWSAARSCRSSPVPACPPTLSPPASPPRRGRRAMTPRSSSSSPPWASPDARQLLPRASSCRAAPLERACLLLNLADDPTIERLLTPRVALTIAEHLAFEPDLHVLVVMTDMTAYCEALREIAAAREEIPAGAATPATCTPTWPPSTSGPAAVRGRHGSLTQLMIVTHARRRHHPPDPRPHRLHHRRPDRAVARPRTAGRLPPIDVLPSLSRLMNAGVGAGQDP